MAKPRASKFPVDGDVVLAEDGSVWAYAGETWTQNDPHLSRAEMERVETEEKARLDKLSAAHRVYGLAFGATRLIKREGDLNESDPIEAFVHALAASAMRDAVVAVTDPQNKGPSLESKTESLLRTFLGDPEMGTVRQRLQALRAQVSDEAAPDGVAARAREPLTVLGDIAGGLSQGSEARATINALVKSRAPQPLLAEKLFRQLASEGQDQNIIARAYDAATRLNAAFGS